MKRAFSLAKYLLQMCVCLLFHFIFTLCLKKSSRYHDRIFNNPRALRHISYQSVVFIIAGSFKSQLIDYFRGAITSWELVEGSLWQFYDNET